MSRVIELTRAGLEKEKNHGCRYIWRCPTADSKSAGKKGVFTMIFEAIAASQMKKAEREIAQYRHLLPRDGDESLPFGGW